MQTHGDGDDGLLFHARRQADHAATILACLRGSPEGCRFTEATGIGLHALRYHYASLLIRFGESVKVVWARLGRASAAETRDTCSHLWPYS